MKKLIYVLLTFMLMVTTNSNAKYIQVADQESTIYPYEVLNFQLFFEKDNMTVGDILSKIESNTNLRVFDHIEIPSNQIIPDSSSYKTVGGMLHRILKEYNGIPYVDQYVIHLDFYETTSLKLPYGWDIENTVEKISKYYPDVQFNIEGFKIKAFGDKYQIKLVSEKFEYLNKIANQKLKLKVKVFEYVNEKIDKKPIYISNRSHELELKAPVKEIEVMIGHNEDLNVLLNDSIYNLTFDLQSQEIILKSLNVIREYSKENKIKIPLKYFEKAGLVVPSSSSSFNFRDLDSKNSFMFVFTVSEGFFN